MSPQKIDNDFDIISTRSSDKGVASCSVHEKLVYNAVLSFQVTLIGAAGGIGQPLALLLKRNPAVTDLALYGRESDEGPAVDLSHINSPAKVCTFHGLAQIRDALQDAQIVVLLASIPLLKGMTRTDMFEANARVILPVSQVVATVCPTALVMVVSNPVNSLLPLVAEIHPEPRRVFGITTLDAVRACSMLAELKGLDVRDISVPVIGGHSPNTIVPLFSKAHTSVSLSGNECETLAKQVQTAGRQVVDAKGGKKSATLSMAHAASLFIDALIRAINGESVVEYAFVKSNLVPGLAYFASPIRIGPSGVEKVYDLDLNCYESSMLEKAVPFIKADIEQAFSLLENKSWTHK